MTKTKKNFLRDLARGSNAEQLVANLFSAVGFPSEIDKEARINWDVKSECECRWPGLPKRMITHFTTEVKYDEYEKRSGNIAIEVYNPRLDKPSGLTATKAFFWAQVLVDEVVWITPVDSLKIYIDNHEPGRIIEHGGDNNAKLLLYPSNQILADTFTRIDTMTKDELHHFVIQQLEEI